MPDKNPTVKDILRQWLSENGYEGIGSGECSCLLGDLMPCEGNPEDCMAGYKIQCPDKDECGCGGFHISSEKPEQSTESEA